jgi:DNA-directed RNA polymerase alpha subunit
MENEKMNQPEIVNELKEFGLSTRICNSLAGWSDIITIEDLLNTSVARLLRCRNFGIQSLKEIQRKLKKHPKFENSPLNISLISSKVHKSPNELRLERLKKSIDNRTKRIIKAKQEIEFLESEIEELIKDK